VVGSSVEVMSSVVLGVVSSPEEEFIIFFSISLDDMSGEVGEMGDLMSLVLQMLGVIDGVMSFVGQIVVSGNEDGDSVDGLGGVGGISSEKEFIFFSIVSLDGSVTEMVGLVGRVGFVLSGVSSPEEEFVFFSIVSLDGSVTEMMGLVGRVSLVLGGVLSPEEEFVFFSIVFSDGVVGSSVEMVSSVIQELVSSPEEEFIIFFSISLNDVSGEVGEMGDLMSLVLQMLGVVDGVMSFVGQIVVSGNEDGDSVDGLGGVGGVSSKEEFIFFSIVSSDGVVSSSVEMGESRLNSRLVGQIVMGEMGDGGLVEMGDMVDGSVVGQVVSNRTVNGSEAELFSLNERDSAKSEKAEDNDRSHA